MWRLVASVCVYDEKEYSCRQDSSRNSEETFLEPESLSDFYYETFGYGSNFSEKIVFPLCQ